MTIPEDALGAAGEALRDAFDRGESDFDDLARAAVEAAAPHMLNLAKREAWDANLEIQRLRDKLAKAAK